MHFCPSCGNILLVEPDVGALRCPQAVAICDLRVWLTCCVLFVQADGMRFFCQTCPYLFQITDKVEKKVPLQRKQVDDVLGGDEAWENVDQTESESTYQRRASICL